MADIGEPLLGYYLFTLSHYHLSMQYVAMVKLAFSDKSLGMVAHN
jgi:hypothetical protein